jgi:hypothetical protein
VTAHTNLFVSAVDGLGAAVGEHVFVAVARLEDLDVRPQRRVCKRTLQMRVREIGEGEKGEADQTER